MEFRENKNILKSPGDRSKVYCDEPYAQDFYNILTGNFTRKDLKEGEILKVIDLKLVRDEEVEVTCENYDTLYFSLPKEKKFIEILGLDESSFTSWIRSGNHLDYLKSNKMHIIVENVSARKGSLYQAHLRTIAREFREQITKPTHAYTAKIIEKNHGGFLVDVQGIRAFLPGSLAAANKIINFEEYIGKSVNVMIEDFLVSSNIFVVSYKKYLDYILPGKLGELERNQRMEGTVTGTSKFGIFIEFDEIFTGLLHTAEMSPETLEKFNRNEFRAGKTFSAWLKDIKDNKLILTETDPSIKHNEMEQFREKVEGNTRSCNIVSIKPHGALMEVEKGVLGLLPLKEMKKVKRKVSVGEVLDVFIKKVDTSTGKIYLTITDEHVPATV
jgi:ribosomal protein S1